MDLSKLRHLGRDGVATWASALLLGGAMLAWRDLFFFAKAVYIPAWAEGLPGQLHLPAYMAFLCLLPASFATLKLPAAIRATVSAVCVAPLPALALHTFVQAASGLDWRGNVLFNYVWAIGFHCALPAALLLVVRLMYEVDRAPRGGEAGHGPGSPAQVPAHPPPAEPAPVRCEIRSTSPTGQYQVRTFPWEPRMSLWVEPPELMDARSGESLLKLADACWSLEGAEWRSESVVALRLRKYPDEEGRGEVRLVVDCKARVVEIGTGALVPMSDVEHAIERHCLPRDGAASGQRTAGL